MTAHGNQYCDADEASCQDSCGNFKVGSQRNLYDYSTDKIAHMKRHVRTHAGEKPYNCSVCSYKSAGKANLMRHLRIHSGDKPYKCDICKYASTNAHHLKRHKVAHHNVATEN